VLWTPARGRDLQLSLIISLVETVVGKMNTKRSIKDKGMDLV